MDVELNRVEAELQQEEAALHAELTRLLTVSAELERRLGLLKKAAASAAHEGVRDPALDGRLERTRVPDFDADAPFDAARPARQAAVRARRDCNVQVRASIAQTKQALTALSQQVLADEKVAQRLAAQAEKARTAAKAPPPPVGDETIVETRPPPPAPSAPPVMKKVLGRTTPPLKAKTAPEGRAARVSPRVKMQVQVDLHSDTNFFTGFSSNLSDGGVFVATVNLLPIGTETELTFTLPAGQKISTRGVVRWVREVNDKLPDAFPGMGIEFVELDHSAHDAIGAFVSEREPIFYAGA